MTVTNFNAGSLAARQTETPKLTNECWANNETATAKCCTQFGGTRIPLNDSSIAACSYHEVPKAWYDCVAPAGSTTYICDIKGASHSGGSVKGVSSGGVLISSLLLVQVFTALLLS
ncbi:hypothetical protein C8J57DRAFT_1510511 [Mycena rebaudengoi]|nr:hypothetical protein C8J57DRAFT_1510511 [Mycena rebaudengoi]